MSAFAAITFHASLADADEQRLTDAAPPRVIVTALAAAGNEYVLRGLAEVRIEHGFYAGAGYGIVVHPTDIIYHGPNFRGGSPLPRRGSSPERKQTGTSR